MVNSKRSGDMVALSDLVQVVDSGKKQCDAHGEYESTLVRFPAAIGDRWSPCPVCMTQRIELEDREAAAEAHRERQQAKAEAMLNRAAIPKRFLGKTLESFRVDPANARQCAAYEKITAYVAAWDENKKNGTSLILCGNPGTGKTHLATAMAAKLLERGQVVLFARMIEIVRSIKESYTTQSYDKENGLAKQRKLTEREVLEGFAKPDLLIIDEVGRQHGTDFERMMLFEVIQSRYELCKPTILVTNLPLKSYMAEATQTKITGLDEYLDEAARDRLREGGGRAIVFDWASVRSNI
jgi:DNA replication protein DnaC